MPIQLLVGELVVAEGIPDVPRHDISEALGQPVTPGFVFDASVLARATELADATEDTLSVRIAGTNLRLGFCRRAADRQRRHPATAPPQRPDAEPQQHRRPRAAARGSARRCGRARRAGPAAAAGKPAGLHRGTGHRYLGPGLDDRLDTPRPPEPNSRPSSASGARSPPPSP
ncbi:MAG: hypothetical protein WDN04_04600 [Rhodospirillales bacterium]